MARINIEETLWSDPRFMRLCVLLGDEMKAVGAIVLAWRTAQKHWCPDRQPIPRSDFTNAGLPLELVTSGLAETIGEGIRLRGSDEHFSWWFQRQDAGRKGGQATAKRKPATAKRTPTERKQNVPSSSSSSSLSSSSSDSNSGSISLNPSDEVDKRPSPASTELNRRIWEAYRQGYFQRYQVEPVRNAKINANIADFGRRVGEEAPEIVAFYLRHNDSFYVRNTHSFGHCLSNAESLRTQWLKGKAITQNDVRNYEKDQGLSDLLSAVRGGKV